MDVQVKVCGITNLDDAQAAVEAGATMLGLNFFAGSPRCVTPAIAASIAERLPPTVRTVGVFVNETRERVVAIAGKVGLRALQFHGDEDPAYCRAWPQTIIKALRVRDAGGAAAARAYDVDFILADAYLEGHLGGTGRRVALEWLEGLNPQRLIIAGGLTAENVAEVVRAVRPYAVDVASGIEQSPGKKDHTLMRRFITHALAA